MVRIFRRISARNEAVLMACVTAVPLMPRYDAATWKHSFAASACFCSTKRRFAPKMSGVKLRAGPAE